MRQEPLTGYCIHRRPYQEKRAIYRFFCQRHGMVDGVARQDLLLFMPITAFATGKTALKTLTQCQYQSTTCAQFAGFGYYGALYANELLYQLLPIYQPAPELFAAYRILLKALRCPIVCKDAVSLALKYHLRRFEMVLLAELGAALDFCCDNWGESIRPSMRYRFRPMDGFCIDERGEFLGQELQALGDYCAGIGQSSPLNHAKQLAQIGQLHRILLDCLRDYKPLYSRQLWQDQMRFMSAAG